MSKPRKMRTWPIYFIGASAAVAVWSGWVGLGELSGFGVIHPLPGIWGSFHIDTSITLPIGVEAYGAYAMGAWMSTTTPKAARKFAKRSAIGSLGLGMLGQVAFHLLNAAHRTAAPWEIVTAVSCLPVITLGFAAALIHLLHLEAEPDPPLPAPDEPAPVPVKDETFMLPQLGGPVPMPAVRAPWEDPAWEQPPPTQPEFTPVTETGSQEALGTVSVRNPLNRLDRKIAVQERVNRTGSFPAVTE